MVFYHLNVLRHRLGIVLILLSFYAPTSFGLTVAVLGDSLSAGYGISEDEGWVRLLETQLQSTLALDATVINASVSGATTAAGLTRLPTLLKAKPDIIIIALGANDGLQGKPIDYITGNLNKMVEASLASGAKVVLLGVRLPPNLGKRYTEPFFNQYAQIASKYNITYVPFMLEGIAGNEALMQKDGLHPNSEAQVHILSNVWPALNVKW